MITLTPLKHRKARSFRIEIAPLIDVVFILLIFFAVSTSLVIQHKGIKLDLPTAVSSVKEKKGVFLSISKAGDIFYDGRQITLADIRTETQDRLKDDPDLKLIFQADETTPYQTIISALDAVRLGGCFNIILEATVDKAR